jgi:ferrous iron transport protein A
MMVKCLDQVPIGGAGLIREITTDHITKERLESLGLIRGVEIGVIRKSPLGSPKIYRCLNTLVALRNEIARQIQVEVSDEQK